jgi:glutaminyl-tRNA synthetase
LPAEVRLYSHLFTRENPADVKGGEDFTTCINPDSLEILAGCRLEPNLADAQPESIYQFERLGYFCVDRHDSSRGRLVFNRSVTLRDTWAKMQKKV